MSHSPWGLKELDMTEWLSTAQWLSTAHNNTTYVKIFDWGYYLFDEQAEAQTPSITLGVVLISIVWDSVFSEYETLIL